jgi:hypothetical protein
MIKKIEWFFYILTMDNWGLPYHLFLSYLAVNIGEKFTHLQWVVPAVFAIGLFYEIYQMRKASKRKQEIKKDSMQDIVANLIGILLGIYI